jgi:hypothetical protein
MSSVNGVGSTPTFEKYQGSEKLAEKRVGEGSKKQGPQGVSGAGNQVGRRRLDVDGKRSSAGAKAQKADPFKEILKMLKGLIETLSAMITKLGGSASGETSSTATTTSGGGSAAGGSSGTANSATTSGTKTSLPSQPNASQTAISSVGSAGTSSVGNSGTTNSADASNGAATTDVDEVPSSNTSGASSASATQNPSQNSAIEAVGSSNDDLSAREESEAALVTTPSTTTVGDQRGEGLQALKDETGAVSVLTDDGFTIRADVKDQAWTISGPDGFATRIWGDPHVSESDGDTWDFLKQSTFIFGKNKVTVEVVPAQNGMTYSSRISVYSGDDRVTISGIETNKPTIDAVARDGEQHDAQLSDGDIFTRGNNTRGESWSKNVDGKKDVMGH